MNPSLHNSADDSADDAASDASVEFLAAQVDLALSAVPAGASRKRVMREELLAHLLDAYHEELARHAEPQLAAESAMSRLGDVHSLGNQLSASVPSIERILWSCFGKEAFMRKAYWYVVAAIAVIYIGLGLALPSVAELRRQGRFDGSAGFKTTMLCVGLVIVLLGLYATARGIARLRTGR